MKSILTLSPGRAQRNRPHALLHRSGSDMTRLFILVMPRTVRALVVRLSEISSVFILFLSDVTWLLIVVRAGPTTWAQTPLSLPNVNRPVVRAALPKAHDAARQTGSVCVPAVVLGDRFVRTRCALKD